MAASSSADDTPFVVDQKPTTGTIAIVGWVVVAVRVGRTRALGIAALVWSGSGDVNDCEAAPDIAIAANAAAPIHRRAIRNPRTGPA